MKAKLNLPALFYVDYISFSSPLHLWFSHLHMVKLMGLINLFRLMNEQNIASKVKGYIYIYMAVHYIIYICKKWELIALLRILHDVLGINQYNTILYYNA